jgi:hypothetical protein
LDVPIWIGIFHEEVNPHNMGVEETPFYWCWHGGWCRCQNGTCCFAPTRNVVMVDTNEGVNDAIVVMIWIGKTTTFEVVENICLPSSCFNLIYNAWASMDPLNVVRCSHMNRSHNKCNACLIFTFKSGDLIWHWKNIFFNIVKFLIYHWNMWINLKNI